MYKNFSKNDIRKGLSDDNLTIKTDVAYCFNNENFDYIKLVELLNSDSIDLKRLALLNIERIKSSEDAQKLLLCLIDKDTRVREYSSFLIKEHLADYKYRHFFDSESSIDILVNSLKDTNPKVCRNVTLALQHTKNKLTTITKIVKIIKTKNTFIIYWGLYALENILTFNDVDIGSIVENITYVISETSNYKEYQIREKAAFIIKTLNQKEIYKKYINTDNVLSEIKFKLLNDENFYVRNAISFTS